MGIQGLAKLIADAAPEAIKEMEIGGYFGRRIAIDASMSIYQFLIAIRNHSQQMTNDKGETTSHLIGLFYRTVKMLEVGIKPVYVFDGAAPRLKAGELEKRADRRREAEQKLAEARERLKDDLTAACEVEKQEKRLVRATRKHNDECKKLLSLLGVPIIQSPSEAEAQCAELAKEGLVYAIATEDMDGLTFGAPRLLRFLSIGTNDRIKEYNYEKTLAGFGLTRDQFIDLCILMGCDYCDSIKGIGPKKGLDLIQKYGSIERILKEKLNYDYQPIEVIVDYQERKRDPEISEKLEKVEEDLEESKKEMAEPKKEEITEDQQEVKKPGELSIEEILGAVKNDDEDADDEKLDESFKSEESETEETEKKNGGDDTKNGHHAESDGGSEGEAGTPKKKKSGKKNGGTGLGRTEVPHNWLFEGARKLFKEPNVLRNKLTEADLKPQPINEEGLIEFLCKENGFSEDRVKSAVQRIKDSKSKHNQSRIDTFFKVMPGSSQSPSSKGKQDTKGAAGKRGGGAAGGGGAAKKGRGRPR